MRILLRYFNSGRIPFGSPDWSCALFRLTCTLICMGGVLIALKSSYQPRGKKEMAGSGLPLTPAYFTRLGRRHRGIFKACCFPSSIPAHLGAYEFVVDHGLHVALDCKRAPPHK